MSIDDDIVQARSPFIEGEFIDLQGQWLMPKFCDAHCHILPTGLDLQKLHLGSSANHADVLDLVAQRHVAQPEGWLLAVHYDQTKYPEGHLSRWQIDQISSDRPILLRHSNGHASVANSAALALAGVGADTPDPVGGQYGRNAAGELDGTLFELAHEHVTSQVSSPTVAEMTAAILDASASMANLNIACASDMMTGRFNLARELDAYERATNQGGIEMRLYVQWRDVFGPRAEPLEKLRERFKALRQNTGGRAKVAGIKIFADGAIGSATAAIYGRYSGKAPSGPVLSSRKSALPSEVSGQIIYSPEKLTQMVQVASDAGFQVAIHAIGDHATDLVMDAFEVTGDPSRHRLEHAMILSDAQIERLAALNCFVTFQPEFLMRFGHSYLRQLGPERAAKIKRTRSLLDAGVRLSFSSDRPIVEGDPRDGIRTAVHRPAGFDPAENCSISEAIRSYTVEGYRVNGDVGGELLTGQKADFQTLSGDPKTLF